jgi:hypothetical protein
MKESGKNYVHVARETREAPKRPPHQTATIETNARERSSGDRSAVFTATCSLYCDLTSQQMLRRTNSIDF